MPSPARRLAGIRDDVSPEQTSVYHAVAREAALEAFGRDYEQELTAPQGSNEPEYVVTTTAEGDLLVIAGLWPAAERSFGRLVAPRELFELLLEDPFTTAVWCDEEDGEGLAITGYSVAVRGEPMLLAVARSARALGETDGVMEIEYEEERLPEGEWDEGELDDFLVEHDGDAVVLHPSVLAELVRIVDEVDDADERAEVEEAYGRPLND
jgi:hypothetical protein